MIYDYNQWLNKTVQYYLSPNRNQTTFYVQFSSCTVMVWVLLGSAISIKIVFCTFPVSYEEFVVEIHHLTGLPRPHFNNNNFPLTVIGNNTSWYKNKNFPLVKIRRYLVDFKLTFSPDIFTFSGRYQTRLEESCCECDVCCQLRKTTRGGKHLISAVSALDLWYALIG